MAHSGINVLFEGTNFARLMGGLWTAIWIAGISLVLGLVLGTIHPLHLSPVPGILPDCPNGSPPFPGLLYSSPAV